ncbi:FtsH protease activity modulator HflK [Thiobacter aerophilum]|uniref:Protein HflK n=1 Tax=Thiobacter aerophilum TaxID=3121275 RepID=A0ABV0EI81_9BURK
MAWNDPDWGRKSSGGPPDLDELWRNFNAKLNRMFGGKGGNRPPAGEAGQPGFRGAPLLIVLILAIWLGSGFYIVNARERGVVLRFGKFVELTMPGPRWHMPYPIETVEIVDVEGNRVTEIGYRQSVQNRQPHEATMLTGDKSIVNVLFAVQYRVTDPQQFLFNNQIGDDQAYVRQIAESAMREVVGRTKIDSVLYESTQVANKAGELIQQMLERYQSGITVQNVTISQVQPPEQVQAAFDDANRADQDRKRMRSEGEAYANDVIPKAKGTAARLLQEAEGYRQSVIANAEGDAARFRALVAEYNKAPAVTRDRLYLEAMQQILSNTTKIVVDQKSGTSLLYLPLDKLMQHTTPEAASMPQPKPAATPDAPRAGADEARMRDLLRNREGR